MIKKGIPDVSVLSQSAAKIALDAQRRNELHLFSVNQIKRQLERDFSLEENILDNAYYKKVIGQAVRSALETGQVVLPLQSETYEASKQKQQEPKEVQELVQKPKIEEKQIVSKSLMKKTDGEGEKERGKEREKARERKKEITSSSARPVSQPPSTKKVYKMPNPEDRGRRDFTLKTLPTAKETEGSKSAPRKPTMKRSFKSHEYIEDDEEDDSAITDSSGNGEKSSEESSSPSKSEEHEQRRKRKKRQEEGSRKVNESSCRNDFFRVSVKRSRSVRETEPSEGDEATIARYKALVSACGARKKWSKEFENYPNPKQQINRLKEILAELGMKKGRYSMEKAKQIKRKRDLARELEDVIEYERKAGISRDRRKKPGRLVGELDTETETETESDSDGSGSDDKPTQSASTAIKKYLSKQREER